MASDAALRPPPRGSARTLVAVLCLVVFGVVLAGLTLEGIVRAFVPVSDYFWEWDPAVGVRLIAGKRGRAIKRGLFDTPVEINSHGFRDRERSYDKPAGTYRIVLLGDSFLEAMQVPLDQSLPALLETRLRGNGIQAEVINLGVSGLGTARQYLMLLEHGLRYHPDLVLLFFVGNDVSDNSRRLQGLPYVPYPVPGPGGAVARDEAGRPQFTPAVDQTSRLGVVAGFLRNHSKAYRLIRETVDGSPAINAVLYRLRLVSTPPAQLRAGAASFGFYEIYRTAAQPSWTEAWALTEDMLLAIRDLAEAHHARFAVAPVPAAWEVYPQVWEDVLRRVPAMRTASLDLDGPAHRVDSFLAQHRIAHVELLPAFRREAPHLPVLYIRGDAHWTAAGHRLAAALLEGPVARMVRGDGLLAGVSRDGGAGRGPVAP